jgi:putative ABC transport system substrate-binding protein
MDALQEGLHELGYVEGQNLVIAYRYAEGRLDRFPDLATELVALPVEVLVSFGGTPQTAAVMDRLPTTPIVFVAAGDPVESGLVASLARPGGNATGLSTGTRQLGGKRLEVLKEAVPVITRVAVLWNAANAAKARELREAQAVAPSLHLQVRSLEVYQPNDFEAALQAATSEGADSLSVLNDPLMFSNRARIVRLAAERRLPAVYDGRDFAQAGGLIAYGPSFAAAIHRAATYVDRILKGAKPADLPIEQPMTFDFIINLQTAQALGLTIPQHVLLQATEVIQ